MHTCLSGRTISILAFRLVLLSPVWVDVSDCNLMDKVRTTDLSGLNRSDKWHM